MVEYGLIKSQKVLRRRIHSSGRVKIINIRIGWHMKRKSISIACRIALIQIFDDVIMM